MPSMVDESMDSFPFGFPFLV